MKIRHVIFTLLSIQKQSEDKTHRNQNYLYKLLLLFIGIAT